MINKLQLNFIWLNIFIVILYLFNNNIVNVNGQGNYTQSEQNALVELHRLADDILHLDYQKSDHFLIRWLRARNMDVSATKEMLLASMKWRKENNIDSIINETILQFSPPIYTSGSVGYENEPIILFNPTVVDMRRMVINGNTQKMVRYWDQILELAEYKLKKVSDKSDGKIYQGISLMDLHGFNIRTHTCLACIRVFIDWANNYERNHPAMAKHIVWINAPRVFLPVLELVRPLLSPATRKALKVFSADKKEWSSYLFQIIPVDQLPNEFGGTRKNNLK